MQGPVSLYLSSLESERFEPIRTCEFVSEVAFASGKVGVVVRLDPPVVGQDFGTGADLSLFVLVARFANESVSPVSSFPCFVHIALPHPDWDTASEFISVSELQSIAWGELYRTAADAEIHSFD
jgi:hypothetical protein